MFFSFSTCHAVIWLFTKHYYSLKQIYQCSVLAHPLKGHQDWIILSRILRGVKRSTNHESPPSSTIMHICVYSLSHAIGRSPLVITQLQNSHPYIWSSWTFIGILRDVLSRSLFSSKLYLLRSKGSSWIMFQLDKIVIHFVQITLLDIKNWCSVSSHLYSIRWWIKSFLHIITYVSLVAVLA